MTLRLLQVVPWLDSVLGGPAQSGLNICVAMRRAGIQNTLVFTRGIRPVANSALGGRRLEREGIPAYAFEVFQPSRSRTRRWGASPALVRWLARSVNQFDVVHVHGAWGASQLAGLIAARVTGRPCVLTPHETLTDFDVGKGRRRTRVLVKRALKALYLRNVSLVVFSSTLEARDSLPSTHRPPFAVIPHPLGSALEVPLDPEPGNRTSRPFTVGFLGRFHPKKNLELLLRSFRELPDDARLVIAGGGPRQYEGELRALARELGLEGRVSWCGFVEGDARWQMFDSIDVLAVPSQYECFGMVGAESLARGTPVVVSRNTGVAALVERHDCGIVAEPTQAAFANALGDLAEQPQRLERMGERGREVAEAELSLRAYGEAIRREYESLLMLVSRRGPNG